MCFAGQINGNTLKIGNTVVALKPHHDLEALVPDVLFYENQQVCIKRTSFSCTFNECINGMCL